MNELKFRAWDRIKKKLLYDLTSSFNSEKADLVFYHGKIISMSCNLELTQFIGHKDVDKKEIYIGDIIDWDNECIIEIKAKDDLGFYYDVIKQENKNIISFDIRFYRSGESAKIIGNSFEDEDILKKIKSKSYSKFKEALLEEAKKK